MRIDKGVPLGSGLVGSAASAVVAANAPLPHPCGKLELLKSVMQGEAMASGSLHVDNTSASLLGGLVLTVGIDHLWVNQIPVPEGIRAFIVQPHRFLSRRQERAILKRSVELSDFVGQTADLAGFISGCYTKPLDLIRCSFEDVAIEPQRQALIPGFQAVRPAAVRAPGARCRAAGVLYDLLQHRRAAGGYQRGWRQCHQIQLSGSRGRGRECSGCASGARVM